MSIIESYSEYTSKGKTCRYYDFNTITNPTDAYFIGYMSSDGSYIEGKKEDKIYPRMGITSTDIFLVEFFVKRYSPDTSINYREPRSSIKVKANRSTAEAVFPRKLSNIFNNFGIFTFKPKRRLIGIPKIFLSAYILGVLDADGCFVIRHRKDCRTPRLNIHISSGAVDLLKDVQLVLERNLNISSSIYNRKNMSELRINNTQSSVKFGHWVYTNLPQCYNYKKHNIFKNYLNFISSSDVGELLEA